MSLYLDASVILPTLVREEATSAVEAYLLAAQEELLISEFAASEVASALSRLVRMKSVAPEDADRRLSDFEIWRAATSTPAELRAADARLAYAYVRRFDLMLRAPDALHLAIARRLGATLLTLDRRLVRAAGDLGIGVATPATR